MSEWVDLTQTLSENSPTLPPLHPKPEFEDFATLTEDRYKSTLLHIERVTPWRRLLTPIRAVILPRYLSCRMVIDRNLLYTVRWRAAR
jgi:hypothetical protein